MRLLFLTDNFPPEVNAPATRTYEHCLEWVRAGIEVTVITCAPNFPGGEVYEGYRNRLWQREEIDGIKVIRVWSYVAPNDGFYKRVIDYVSFGVMAMMASLFVKTDLIVATSPQFFTAVAGFAASVLKRKPWVMEVRDLWPVSIRAVGIANNREKLMLRLEALELFLYRRANRVVVVTNSFRADLVRRGISSAKIAVITNGVYADKFPIVAKDEALETELGLMDKFVVGYVGTHGLAHKLVFILNAAASAPPNVHFLLVGDGAKKQELLLQKEKYKLLNVTLLPAVPKAEVARYISVIDVALVNLRRAEAFKAVIPSKIFENVAMGKPILLGVEGESAEIVSRSGAGLCFIPEDREDFLRQLNRLATDDEVYAECRSNCRPLALEYDRGRLAERMLVILRQVAVEKRRGGRWSRVH